MVVNKGKQRLSVLLLVTFVAEGHRGFSRGLKSSVMDGATGLLKVTRAQIASAADDQNAELQLCRRVWVNRSICTSLYSLSSGITSQRVIVVHKYLIPENLCVWTKLTFKIDESWSKVYFQRRTKQRCTKQTNHANMTNMKENFSFFKSDLF